MCVENCVKISDKSDKKWKSYSLYPECSTWHKFPNPEGAISTKNVIFPIQGTQFWLRGGIGCKISYFQPRVQDFDQICPIYNLVRGHNFNQKCHIANTCGMILAKFIIKYILYT